ncbi:hypothetical protein AB1N83_012993, partial [Pleurotus pulmonarius]
LLLFWRSKLFRHPRSLKNAPPLTM